MGGAGIWSDTHPCTSVAPWPTEGLTTVGANDDGRGLRRNRPLGAALPPGAETRQKRRADHPLAIEDRHSDCFTVFGSYVPCRCGHEVSNMEQLRTPDELARLL